jgi:citrate lyase subunit beta/citryl-CoA lyase
MTFSAHRSYLFVPGDRPDRFDKACASGADTVVVDLEDAVAPTRKAHARSSLRDWLNPQRRVVVRINGADSAWFDEDLSIARLPGVAAVMLPKAQGCDEVAAVRAAIGARPVLPIIESAAGMDKVEAVSRCAQVQRLVFGSVDFQADLRIPGDGLELLYFRSRLVLASRLAGLARPVDGVTLAVHDEEVLRADANHARQCGFGAKLCIHPNQVAPVNATFGHSSDEVAWARRVVQAAQAAGGAAVAVDGRMVDRPVVLRALAVVDEARGAEEGA